MPLLECHKVIKTFGGLLALNGTTLDVHEGEILGLVGPNGSGKSTLINVISGQYQADKGVLRFAGQEINGVSSNRLSHLGIARTYQIPRPFHSMTVLDNVALAKMFGREAHSRLEAQSRAMEILAFVGLHRKAHVSISQLTLHQRKFLEMARALASEPKLLLLDEVLAGLNPAEVNHGIDLIQHIRDTGLSIVFVEHNLSAVLRLSDRMVVLNYGQKIAEGQPDKVLQDEQVVAAYLGAAHG